MSKAIKQLVVIAAVIAISMVFIIQFRPGTNVELKGGPTCAIEVAGECIPHSDFVTAYRLARPNVDEEQLKAFRLRARILEGLVERHLLLKEADRLDISVSDRAVAEYIATKKMARFSLPAGALETLPFILRQATGGQVLGPPVGPARYIPAIVDPKSDGFDYERYQKWVVRGTGKTEQDFKTFQNQEALAARMRQLVTSRVQVSEKEARERYEADNERVVVDYVKLNRDYYRDWVVDASEEAVDAWAEQNAEEMEEAWTSRKEQFTPSCRKARHILVRVDETNPDQEAAKAEAKETIEAARARITGGDTFAEVAREVSDDTATADEGGDLGCFAQGQLAVPATTKAIEEAVYALDEGALSEPIETRHGVHLVKTEDVLEGQEAETHGRRVVARELYQNKEAERIAAEGGKQILAAVRAGKPLDQALHDHLLSVLPEDAKAAYRRGAAAKGEEPEGEGDDASAGVTAWSDPARPELATSDPFPRGGPPFSQVEDPMGAAQKLFELAEPGAVSDDVIKLYDGYAVAQLKERKPVTDESWKEDRDDFVRTLQTAKQRDALIHYIEQLRDKYAKELVFHVSLREDESEPGGEG